MLCCAVRTGSSEYGAHGATPEAQLPEPPQSADNKPGNSINNPTIGVRNGGYLTSSEEEQDQKPQAQSLLAACPGLAHTTVTETVV